MRIVNGEIVLGEAGNWTAAVVAHHHFELDQPGLNADRRLRDIGAAAEADLARRECLGEEAEGEKDWGQRGQRELGTFIWKTHRITPRIGPS